MNNGGGVFIQSKERIAAFTPRDDDLRGCLEQFKRLTARMAVGGLTDWPRPLDWKVDRLILAVREYPQTLYRGISELVKTARSQSDWVSFESTVSQTEEGRQSLETCLAILQDVAPEITLEPEHQLALFQCMQVTCFDVLEDSSHSRTEAWRLLGDHVVTQRTRVQDAWRVLGEYSTTLASAHGVATLDSTRKELSSAGIPLQGFVDYREDFQRLQERSASEVSGLQTGLPCPGSSAIIEIPRPALVAQIVSALDDTRLVIVTGSPGCGKSTVLAQVYGQIPAGAGLFFRVDSLEGQTLAQLERNLGLAHSVYEVIEHSRTGDSAVLIVDALDAARESSQQEAILAFVKAVLDRTSWKVILSMRLYVLNHSRNVRKSLLPYNYRQVAVPELDDAELAQVYQKIPVLQQAVEKLRPVTRTLLANPFNLRLLAEILDASTGEALASFLPAIRTQVQLYQEYWIRVIGEGRGRSGIDRDRRIFTALSAAKLMLEDNKMHVSKNRFVVSAGGLTCVDELVKDGVFVTGQLAEQLSFFHQTYHDFAIAKALQAASPEQIRAWLKESERFLGLRIAMRYRLTLDLLESPDQFWDLWGTLIEAKDVRYLLRSLPAEILASWPVVISELEPLDRLLHSRPTVAVQCFEQVGKKMLVDPTPQTVEQATVWLEWASRYLSELTDNTTWWVLNIMEMCLKQPGVGYTMRQRISALAQRVFERYYPARTDFVERATGFIAAVFPTEEQAEVNILRTGVTSHEPQICRQVVDSFEQIVQADPSLAADLAVMLVTYTETSTEATQFGQSRIFSLTSNRGQDYNMVLWALRVKFPVLLERNFAEAFRVIEAEIGHKDSSWQLDPEAYQAPSLSQQVGNYVLRYRVGSGIWRYELRPQAKHESIVSEFRKWFMNKCSEPTTDDVISKVMLCLYDRNEHPIIWKICLQAAAAYPTRLSSHIAPLLSFPPIWSQDECRHAAWSALQAVFPNLSTDQRATIEQVLLALPEQMSEELAKYEIRTRDAAIAVLPDEYLVTAEARELHKQILVRETPPPEIAEERFPEAHSRPIDPDEGLQISNEYRASNTYRHIRESLDKLRAFEKEWQNKVPTRAACEEIFSIVSSLSEFLSQPQDPPVASDQAWQAEDIISEVAVCFARCKEWLPNDAELAWTYSYLLAASHSSRPSRNPVVNSQTPEFMSWSPAPRIAAAQGLPYLAANYKQWDDEIRSTVERLWRDPVDAVRLQIVGSLHLFDGIAPEWAWQSAEESALRETHVGILAMLADYPLSWWFNTRHEEVIRLCVAVVHRDELAGRFSWQLPRALGGLIGLGFVRHASPTTQAEIDRWLLDIPIYAEFIKASLLCTDQYIIENTKGSIGSAKHRAIDLYLKVAQASLKLEQGYLARNRTDEVIEEARIHPLLEVQNTLIMQLYFLGQRNLSVEELQRGQRPILDDKQREHFLVDTAEVLRICSQFGHPSAIHHLIELCAEVIDLAPQLCVEVLWNIGHADGDPRLIHFENVVLQDVIKAMNVLLADHLNLLKTSPELGSKLLDILDGFDEVGWPEAQRFILHLEDVLK